MDLCGVYLWLQFYRLKIYKMILQKSTSDTFLASYLSVEQQMTCL